MVKRGSAFLFTFLLAAVALGETTVTGTVDRNQLRVGDTFTFSVSVGSDSSVDVAQPRWPDFSGFDLINSWSGNEVQSIFENGRFMTKRRQTFNLQLQAQQQGVFEIGGAEVVVDGQVFRTKTIRIEVVDGSAPAPRAQGGGGANQQQIPGFPPEDEVMGLDDMFNQMLQDRLRRFGGSGGGNVGRGQTRGDVSAEDLFFVDVEVDKTKVYEGEQILTSYYLYTRGRITDIDTLKYPSLVGFWKEDIELATRLNFQPVVINGIQYNRALLAAYALFPIKAGVAEIDPYRAKCTVTSINPFGAAFPKQETKESKAVKIEVIPPPLEGRPADFAGTVGQFTVEAKVDNPSPKVNQPVSVSIKFQGRGNGKLIELPKVEMPKTVDIYDTKSDAKYFKDGRSFKEFQLLVIPRQAGQIEIPGFSISLFDPEKKNYYQLKTDPIVLDVQATEADAQVASSPLATAVDPTAVRKNVFPPLLVSYGAQGTSTPLHMVWPGIYLFVIGLLVWVSKRELGWGKKRDSLRRLVLRRVESLNSLAKSKDWRKAASTAMNLVYFILGELSGIGGGSQELKKLLAKAPPSFRRDFQAPLEKLVRELELVAYAPEEALGSLKSPEEIQKRITEIEKLLLAALDQNFDESFENEDVV